MLWMWCWCISGMVGYFFQIVSSIGLDLKSFMKGHRNFWAWKGCGLLVVVVVVVVVVCPICGLLELVHPSHNLTGPETCKETILGFASFA